MKSRRGVGILTTILAVIVGIMGTVIVFLVAGYAFLMDLLGSDAAEDNQPVQTPNSNPQSAQTNPITQIRVTNVQSWVGGPGESATAFVIQSYGSGTVDSVKLRGIAVPNNNWYYCKGCATQANTQTPLPADFTPESVVIGGTAYTMMTPGPITLTTGETAIVYMVDAGNIASIDAGNTYALQIQAGQASSVTQVSVQQK
jgi:hypothetical protein